MVLIFCDSKNEYIQKLCVRLKALSIEYIVLSECNKIKIHKALIGDFILHINFTNIKLNDIKAIYFASSLNFESFFEDFTYKINDKYSKYVFEYCEEEYRTTCQYIYSLFLNSDKLIGNDIRIKINKLEALQYAKACKLNIPESIVCTTKFQFNEFSNNFKVITKNVSNHFFYFCDKRETKSLYTNVINGNEINYEKFSPSFIQKYIDKKYEVRTFIFYNIVYSMAIFSQMSNDTKFDWRKSTIHPIRYVPYQISLELKGKLLMLIKKTGFNCGAIDLIVDKTNDIYFLEINPFGQFSDMSVYCNYNIEWEIAYYIKCKIENDK